LADAATASSRAQSGRRRDRLLAILVVLAVIGALKLTASVTLPLAFGLFLVAVTWPIYRFGTRWLPRGISALITLAVFLGVIYGISAALYETAEEVAENSAQYSQRFGEIGGQLRDTAAGYGLSMPEPESAAQSLRSGALRLSKGAFGFIGGAVLVCAYLLLGLLEVSDYGKKVSRSPRHSERWKRVAERVAKDFQRYVAVRTLIGLLTGLAVTIGCWMIGLDLALMWGLVNFLLNYIPTLGSIIALVPPVLFALATEDVTTALLVAGVIGGIELVMGNWVDPLIQGRYLKLSPLVVLLSVVLWGWIWGIAGAFIGVPLTLVIVLVCREFDSTRWIAVLLAAAEETRQIEREPLRGARGRQRLAT
jgi:AI-2 transport protein TqsA